MGKFNDIVSRFTNPTSDDVYANSAGNATKTDCATCKIISGGGLVATSLYIAYHTMQQNTKTKRALLSSVSAGNFLFLFNFFLFYVD